MMKALKVAVLSDGISFGIKIFQRLTLIDGIDAYLCLCNNQNQNKILYFIRTIGCIVLRFSVRQKILVVYSFIKGRIFFLCSGLKSEAGMKKIKKECFDIGCHDAGIIYTKQIISLFDKGMLNSHIGLLPRYRGRCVMEWSIYEKNPTGITVFYMDEGIDTGREIVVREEVSVKDCHSIDEAKTRLFSLAPEFYAKAVVNELAEVPHLINDGSGPRFYVMSNKLKKEVNKYFVE